MLSWPTVIPQRHAVFTPYLAGRHTEAEDIVQGAERQIRVPDELLRFASLPMKVTYTASDDSNSILSRILQLKSVDVPTGMSDWNLADVKVNRSMGRPKTYQESCL